MKPTITMIDQLLEYCKWAERSGIYYGDKPQFVKRHEKIIKWLKNLETK